MTEKNLSLLHNIPPHGGHDKYTYTAPIRLDNGRYAGQFRVEIRRENWYWVVEVSDLDVKTTIQLQP